MASQDIDTKLICSPTDLEAIAQLVRKTAENCSGKSLALLSVLRLLEQLHREIRDGLFQESLPDNRQALYALLRDMEADGGWPYIQRMKLQSLLAHLEQEPSDEDNNETGEAHF